MKRSTLFIFLLFLSKTYSNTDNHYANLYADFLIGKFDTLLDGPNSTDILYSETYAKILAAREYIEHEGSALPVKGGGVLTIIDPKAYKKVVDLIDSRSLMIIKDKAFRKNTKGNNYVIYPSTSRDGNLTGNTFPKNTWSLTFDDGPKKGPTEKIVDALALRNIEASFFVLMRQLNKFEKSARYIIDNNMELSLHSYNHKDLNKASKKVMTFEISNALAELEEFSKLKVDLFRLPYGSGMRNKPLREIIAKNNLVHVFWNVDTLDWKDKDPKSIYNRVIKQMNNTPNQSGIILFHDIHAQTVIASQMVMDYLIEEAKTICTVGEVVRYLNKLDQNCI